MDLNKKKQIAYQFYRDRGYTHEQSAGIVGNLIAESGLNSTIKGDPQVEGGSHGIAQWNRGRLAKLKSMYGDKWKDFESQLAFVDWELNNTEKKAGQAIRAAKTIEDATRQMMLKYERPKNQSDAAVQGRTKISNTVQPLGDYKPAEVPSFSKSPNGGFSGYEVDLQLPVMEPIFGTAMTTEEIMNEDTPEEELYQTPEWEEEVPIPQYSNEEVAEVEVEAEKEKTPEIQELDSISDYDLENEYSRTVSNNRMMIDDIFSLSIGEDEPEFFKEGGALNKNTSMINIGRKRFPIPLDVPSLTNTERAYLQKGGKVPNSSKIYKKAVNHAVGRISQGLPVFYNEDLEEVLQGMSVDDRVEYLKQEQNKNNIKNKLKITQSRDIDFEGELLNEIDRETQLELQRQMLQEGYDVGEDAVSDINLYIKDVFRKEIEEEEDLIDIEEGFDERMIQEFMRFGGRYTGDTENLVEDLGITEDEIDLLKRIKGSSRNLTRHLDYNLSDEYKDLYNNASRYKYLKSKLRNSNTEYSREGLATLIANNIGTPITKIEQGLYE